MPSTPDRFRQCAGLCYDRTGRCPEHLQCKMRHRANGRRFEATAEPLASASPRAQQSVFQPTYRLPPVGTGSRAPIRSEAVSHAKADRDLMIEGRGRLRHRLDER